jgi:hypothetical protein
VIDLKKGDFEPEHAGKMNFYCSAVDHQLRHPQDQPTIGLILCQTRVETGIELGARAGVESGATSCQRIAPNGAASNRISLDSHVMAGPPSWPRLLPWLSGSA